MPVVTRRDNAQKRLGLPDKSRPKRSSEEVANEKQLKTVKKANAAAAKNAKKNHVKDFEARLQEKQALEKQTAVKPPVKTQKKVKTHTSDSAVEGDGDDKMEDDLDITRESSIPLVSHNIYNNTVSDNQFSFWEMKTYRMKKKTTTCRANYKQSRR